MSAKFFRDFKALVDSKPTLTMATIAKFGLMIDLNQLNGNLTHREANAVKQHILTAFEKQLQKKKRRPTRH